MLFLMGTNIHSTTSCYTVQRLSKSFAVCWFGCDRFRGQHFPLPYMKLKNSCNYAVIGAVSQYLPWKRSKQKHTCLQSPHSLLQLPPQKEESSKRSWHFSGNHLRLFHVLFVSEPFCSSISHHKEAAPFQKGFPKLALAKLAEIDFCTQQGKEAN